ncbi:MAG: carbohydrate kinase [Ignavibacteriae bacterium]|nr:carbohydrate kinase [Ignavibacteriota bacterium]
MYAIGYDIGSSSIKCAILNCATGKTIAQGSHPTEEMAIQSPRPGWAEQDPELWWQYVVLLTQRLLRDNNVEAARVNAIGISYQMHGLVLVDKNRRVLRPSIIWCDSRAVEIGRKAFDALGNEFCLSRLLNSPGNFTASKLKWVKENEPALYKQVYKAMLPGDFIAMKLSGEIRTSISGLSEGIFWDFERNAVSTELLNYYGIAPDLLAESSSSFSHQGMLTHTAAQELGLQEGAVVAYRAGDQPNNAFSLNVLNPGEVAATAGTSGVVYGVSGKVCYDRKSRVNPFAHVNHTNDQPRLGVLLCINGTGIQNSWLRKNVAAGMSYVEMNAQAATVPVGSEGVVVIPFGNGAERVLENRNVGGQVFGLDFNRHSRAHILRAAQEGIAFSFRYGVDIMKEMGMNIDVIRAGHTNMFLSPVFRQTVANCTGARIELYDTDGSQGAARGAAVGARLYASFADAFTSLTKVDEVHPAADAIGETESAYKNWLSRLRGSAGE